MGNNIELKEIMGKVPVTALFPEAKKSGTEYKSICPFPDHNDTKPSFSIDSERGLWYCFGCGRGGNYVNYILEMGIVSDYNEAIQYLANLAGITLKSDVRNGLLDRLMFYAQKAIKHNKEALNYLENRGLLKEDLQKWNIGYASKTWSSIVKQNIDLAKKYGLANDKERSTMTFRIVLPIKSRYGEIVGVVGRALYEKHKPKYLYNGSFKRNEVLFGYNYTVQNSDTVYLVEGVFDAILMQQMGYPAVAVLGSSISEEQIKLIKEKEIYLVFDGDKAGRKACIKALLALHKADIDILYDVSVVKLPDGKDPADMVKNQPGLLVNLIDNAIPGEAWLIGRDRKYINQRVKNYLKREKLCRLMYLFSTYADNDEHIQKVYNYFKWMKQELKKEELKINEKHDILETVEEENYPEESRAVI